MSQGKPFVGFNSGAYGEIVESGKDGFIVNNKIEFKKCLQEIASGEIIFNQQEIMSHVVKYDAQNYLEKITKLFSGLIREK